VKPSFCYTTSVAMWRSQNAARTNRPHRHRGDRSVSTFEALDEVASRLLGGAAALPVWAIATFWATFHTLTMCDFFVDDSRQPCQRMERTATRHDNQNNSGVQQGKAVEEDTRLHQHRSTTSCTHYHPAFYT